jgi:hypothetical protein
LNPYPGLAGFIVGNILTTPSDTTALAAFPG